MDVNKPLRFDDMKIEAYSVDEDYLRVDFSIGGNISNFEYIEDLIKIRDYLSACISNHMKSNEEQV